MEDKIYVTRPLLPNYEEYCQEIKSIWDNRWLTNNGPKCLKLKQLLQQYLEVKNVDLLTNGHMALELSLSALQLQGEVITTPFTFVSTSNAIVRNGLKPVFCDVNADNFTIDVTKIEKLITNNTCAILPVHVYGNVCNVEAIAELGKKYNLPVIYDAAHAFGVKYKNKGIASYGDISCFSFHATKVFNTIEGGAVCYGEKFEQFGKRINILKDFGISGPEEVDFVGPNAKMTEFSAAMGICNLNHLKDAINSRKEIVNLYNKELENIPGITVNKIQKDVKPNYAYYPIFIDKKDYGIDRNELYNILNSNNIFSRKYFYPTINNLNCYCDYKEANVPIALDLSQRVLTLPLFADLELNQVKKICNIIKKSCK